MKVKKVEMKLGEEFNNMPGVEQIEKMIRSSDLESAEIVDTDQDFWKNDPATLVLAISANSMSHIGLEVGKLAVDSNADEFDYKFDNATKQWICRLWWD